MMKQYFEIKEQHPRTASCSSGWAIFMRCSSTTPKPASQELELVLTGRDCGQEERAPMCGVPYHSCEAYIARLVAKGYKVAICEQMEDPALAKGPGQAGCHPGDHPRHRDRGRVCWTRGRTTTSASCSSAMERGRRGSALPTVSTGEVHADPDQPGTTCCCGSTTSWRVSPRGAAAQRRGGVSEAEMVDFISNRLGARPDTADPSDFDCNKARGDHACGSSTRTAWRSWGCGMQFSAVRRAGLRAGDTCMRPR